MNELVLHCSYHAEESLFFLWGEEQELRKRQGSKSLNVPSHPFSSNHITMSKWQGSYKAEAEKLWLASFESMPQRSLEQEIRGASHEKFKGNLSLKEWQTSCVAYHSYELLSLFWKLPNNNRITLGSDLLWFRSLMLEIVNIIVKQAYLPSIRQNSTTLLAATWEFAEQDEAFVTFLGTMPWACVAANPQQIFTLPRNEIAEKIAYELLNEWVRLFVEPQYYNFAFIDKPMGSRERGRASSVTQKSIRAINDYLGSSWMVALLDEVGFVKLWNADTEYLFIMWQQYKRLKDLQFRFVLRLEDPQGEDELWTLSYLLQSKGESSLLVSAQEIWSGNALGDIGEEAKMFLSLGLQKAGDYFAPIKASLAYPEPHEVKLTLEEAYDFLKEAAIRLKESGMTVFLPRWWRDEILKTSARRKIQSAVNPSGYLSLSELLTVKTEVLLGGKVVERAEYDKLVALKQSLIKFQGEWVVVDPSHLQAGMKLFGEQTVSLSEAMQLSLNSRPSQDGIEIEVDESEGWFKQVMRSLLDTKTLETVPPSPNLSATLRPYQERGLSWLLFLHRYGLRACLADDMGLGKTLQAIAFLLHLYENTPQMKPVLVVCPTSVVNNWKREIERFASPLKVMTHQGKERATKKELAQHLKKFAVVITSYPLLTRDREALSPINWSVMILDEAQNIKNSSTKQAQASRAMTTDYRIALTGTPVENRLSELWSIFNFLNPGYLGTERHFRARFSTPIERHQDTETLQQLRKLTSPFILRRLKTDPTVIDDLPDKIETKIDTPLTEEQAALYEAIVKSTLEKIASTKDAMSRRGLVLALLTRLKQVCNHPAHYLKDGSLLAGRSGKLNRLGEMLEEIMSTQEGDKVLIFTQFAEMGELLRTYFKESLGEDPLWLHGGTPVKERENMLNRFQESDDARVFLLSLKAGGVGLNLTRANHVFHFDRWWNPSVENQATDRAYRIGQKRTVQVHKFICPGTLEERIDELIESKKALAEQVIGSDDNWLTELSTEDLRDLVQLRLVES